MSSERRGKARASSSVAFVHFLPFCSFWCLCFVRAMRLGVEAGATAVFFCSFLSFLYFIFPFFLVVLCVVVAFPPSCLVVAFGL